MFFSLFSLSSSFRRRKQH